MSRWRLLFDKECARMLYDNQSVCELVGVVSAESRARHRRRAFLSSTPTHARFSCLRCIRRHHRDRMGHKHQNRHRETRHQQWLRRSAHTLIPNPEPGVSGRTKCSAGKHRANPNPPFYKHDTAALSSRHLLSHPPLRSALSSL